MWIYIINFVLLLLYGVFIKNKKLLVALSAVQLFLILALRDPLLGVDNATYKVGYEYISTLSFDDMLSRLHLIKVAELGNPEGVASPLAFESGYVVLNWLFGATGLSFHGFLIAYAAFCVFATSKFIYDYSESPTLSFILFVSVNFFTLSFGILRQTLALSIFLLSLPFIKKRKLIPYLLLCFLAFTIHRIAIITLPLYFLYNLRITKRRYLYAGGALLALFAASPLLVNYAIQPLMGLIGKGSYSLSLSFNFFILVMVAIAALIFLFTDFESFMGHRENNFLCWCFLFSIAVEIIGLYNDVIARAIYIPFIAAVALLPNVLRAYENKKLAAAGKVALIALSFAFMIYELHGNMINPYVFCF